MKAKTALKLAVGAIIFALLVVSIGPQKLVQSASSANPWLLAAAFVITPATMLLKFMRWRCMIGMTGHRMAFSRASSIYLVGSFFGMVTPSKVGEIVKFHYLNRHGMDSATALSVSIFDRMFDMVAIAVFLVLGAASVAGMGMFGSSIILFIALLAFAFYLLTRRGVMLRFINFISRFAGKGRLEMDDSKMDGFYAPVSSMRSRPGKTGYMLALSLLIWFSEGVQVSLLIASFGASFGLVAATAAVCIGAIAGLLPITVSGIGTRDAAIVALLAYAGISASTAILSSVIYTFFSMGVPAIIGGVLYMKLSGRR